MVDQDLTLRQYFHRHQKKQICTVSGDLFLKPTDLIAVLPSWYETSSRVTSSGPFHGAHPWIASPSDLNPSVKFELPDWVETLTHIMIVGWSEQVSHYSMHYRHPSGKLKLHCLPYEYTDENGQVRHSRDTEGGNESFSSLTHEHKFDPRHTRSLAADMENENGLDVVYGTQFMLEFARRSVQLHLSENVKPLSLRLLVFCTGHPLQLFVPGPGVNEKTIFDGQIENISKYLQLSATHGNVLLPNTFWFSKLCFDFIPTLPCKLVYKNYSKIAKDGFIFRFQAKCRSCPVSIRAVITADHRLEIISRGDPDHPSD